jgi:hypothetical protein
VLIRLALPAAHQMLQAGEQLLATGRLGGEPGADARAQRDELLAAQLLGQARVAGEHHAQERLRIELRAGHQAQLREHRRAHLLGLVDEQHRAAAGRFQMGEPGLAQRLEAAPAVVRAQRHAKEIAHLAIEVGEVALRMGDRPDGEIGQPRQALGQQTQRHAFARARVAVDHREAALADQPLLDAPAEVLEARRHMDRLGGHLGREGVPLEPVEGEQFGVHARSCSAGGSGEWGAGR